MSEIKRLSGEDLRWPAGLQNIGTGLGCRMCAEANICRSYCNAILFHIEPLGFMYYIFVVVFTRQYVLHEQYAAVPSTVSSINRSFPRCVE